MDKTKKLHTYSEAIRSGFEYLLDNYPDVFVIGQGLWSPWYVGKTMTDLDKKFGKSRIIDTPVSESACTGAAIGAAISNMKPIVVHPRMDFMLYAVDSIVNQAAKWSFIYGGQSQAGVTIRSIINRGGEQGAQHSQSLHSWFAHIPGLKVLMPSTVADARDMLIAATLSQDPVLYIDDRWLYELSEEIPEIEERDINYFVPSYLSRGEDITIVSAGFSTKIALDVKELLKYDHVSVEVIDLRTINPFRDEIILESVKKTKRLIAIDGGWKFCGLSSEILSSVFEKIEPDLLLAKPERITLPFTPAPSSKNHEHNYYPKALDISKIAKEMIKKS